MRRFINEGTPALEACGGSELQWLILVATLFNIDRGSKKLPNALANISFAYSDLCYLGSYIYNTKICLDWIREQEAVIDEESVSYRRIWGEPDLKSSVLV